MSLLLLARLGGLIGIEHEVDSHERTFATSMLLKYPGWRRQEGVTAHHADTKAS